MKSSNYDRDKPPAKGKFGFSNYLKISIYGAALAFLWPSLHSLVIPLRLLDLVPEVQKNTYLGILTFFGLVLAILVQPLAGAISDRSTFHLGRRRPFILLGTLLALLFLPGIGLSDNFTLLFFSYCLLQCACNIAQGPFQAFIPDLVTQERRGLASGMKSLTEVVVSVALLRIIAYFMDKYSVNGGEIWLWSSLSFLGAILVIAMLITLLGVKEKPLISVSRSLPVVNLFKSYLLDIKRQRDFIWFLVSRLFVLMALINLQTFALYFLRDVIRVPNPAAVTGDLLVAVGICLLITVYPAGLLSDKIGRKPVIVSSGVVGATGILWLLFAQSYTNILICGGLLGVSAGAFMSASWALATDLVPLGEEARYLGLTNLATAGAGALARLIGPLIDFLNSQESGLGYSAMLLVCMFYFIIGSILVLKVGKG